MEAREAGEEVKLYALAQSNTCIHILNCWMDVGNQPSTPKRLPKSTAEPSRDQQFEKLRKLQGLLLQLAQLNDLQKIQAAQEAKAEEEIRSLIRNCHACIVHFI